LAFVRPRPSLRRYASLSEIVSYCDERTALTTYRDAPAAFNGLQVAKDGPVSCVGAAVDAGCIPFRHAVEAGVDFLIVHHGLYWDMPRPMTGPLFDRVATLIKGGCALYSSHLPLDGHPDLGNNALLARQLGFAPVTPFLIRDGVSVGWASPNVSSRSALKEQLLARYARVIALEFGSTTPAQVAFCSGSGNSAIPELIRTGIDTLVTGDLREEWFTVAQEHRLNLYLCGHYATEVHGVQALAADVAQRFGLPWRFIPSDNPL
jgi:dinuclear metal center YbgI/SA1388 family protein